MQKEIRFIDLFGGVGGFRLGLQSRQYFRCVAYYEWDKYAVQVYNKRFQENHKPTDITSVESRDIPDHDLLCAGFPCQAFSIAGKRKGFDDTRGTLFFEIARILKDKKPQMVLLENVKGLLSHDRGRTFCTILDTLRELGYMGQYEVLNSKNFGVPQNRERVFIFGSRGKSRPQIFPLGQTIKTNNELEIQGESDRKIMETLTSRGAGEFHSGMKLIYEGAKGSQIRRLTPTECERLQGFPDGFTEGVSDTQRYKMMGNAVTINVIQAIGEKILSKFEEEE